MELIVSRYYKVLGLSFLVSSVHSFQQIPLSRKLRFGYTTPKTLTFVEPKIPTTRWAPSRCFTSHQPNSDNISPSTDDDLRRAILQSMVGLSAEAAWRRAVDTAAWAVDSGASISVTLPKDAITTLESGKAVVVENWLSPSECQVLRQDVRNCYEGGHFKNFVYSRNPNAMGGEIFFMSSFSKKTGLDGPFMDRNVGSLDVRNNLKARMAQVKAMLAKDLQDRPTLVNDLPQTHEMEYLRYSPGAFLHRHTDERHIELQYAGGSQRPKKANASRRSITWMVYLNDDWDGPQDGGQLRLHERTRPSNSPVGARGPHLQIGWLKATSEYPEQPVFLDPNRDGPDNETCMLFTFDASGKRLDLSQKTFPNAALYISGGDVLARKLMLDAPYAARFHLIDAPKSFLAANLKEPLEGVDGGECIRDVFPQSGTLVMFDSVSLPHQVLVTKGRERFAVQGWFHEKLA